MLNVLAYVRAKFREAALLGIQDAVNEALPPSPGQKSGGMAQPVEQLPPPALPPSAPAAAETEAAPSGQATSVPSLQQRFTESIAARAAANGPSGVQPPDGQPADPSSAKRPKRPRDDQRP